MSLTRREHQELNDLVDQLIAATDGHTYWLGPVRDTSLELRAWLDTRVEPAQTNWKCPAPGCRFAAIHPINHPCPL